MKSTETFGKVEVISLILVSGDKKVDHCSGKWKGEETASCGEFYCTTTSPPWWSVSTYRKQSWRSCNQSPMTMWHSENSLSTGYIRELSLLASGTSMCKHSLTVEKMKVSHCANSEKSLTAARSRMQQNINILLLWWRALSWKWKQ